MKFFLNFVRTVVVTIKIKYYFQHILNKTLQNYINFYAFYCNSYMYVCTLTITATIYGTPTQNFKYFFQVKR